MKTPALLLVLALGVSPAVKAAPPICDGTTALTLIGMDTSTGRTLFSVPSSDGKSFWIVELDGDGKSARAWPDDPKGRFSGSVGPGPVLAARPCGASCLQPVRWQDGTWEPVGESLPAPTASTVAPTYDLSGSPWFLVFGSAATTAETVGQQKVWAFRLQGREWENRGGMTVAAVGQPAALPAPQRKDGVLAGTGLFSVSGLPQTWVSGLPGVPVEPQGVQVERRQVLPESSER